MMAVKDGNTGICEWRSSWLEAITLVWKRGDFDTDFC